MKEKRLYTATSSMPNVQQIKAVKITKEKEIPVQLYYKDIDNKIKELTNGKVDKNFIVQMRDKLINKYGKIYTPVHDIELFIKKPQEKEPFFIRFLIDTKDVKEYMEFFIKNIKIPELNKEYIPVLKIGLYEVVYASDEIQEIQRKSLNKKNLFF